MQSKIVALVGSLLLMSTPSMAAKAKAPAKSPAKTTIKLLKPGKAPRAVMTYQLKAVNKLKMTVMTKMTMRARVLVKGQLRNTPPIPTPAMKIETTMMTKGTNAKGMTKLIGSISHIKVLPSINTPPMVVIQLRKALAKLKGSKVQYIFDKQGNLHKGGFQAPKGINQQMRQILNNIRQNMQQIIVPFPTKPIGVGASWEVKIPILRPVRLTQTMRYTLKQNKKGVLFLDVQMTQDAKNQRVRHRSRMGLVQNHIHTLKTLTKGATQIGLRNFLLKTTMKGNSNMAMTVTLRGRSQKLFFRMQMSNSIQTK